VDKRVVIVCFAGVAAYLLLAGESRANDTSESDNAPSIFDEITNTAGDWIMSTSSNDGNRGAFCQMLRVSEGTAGPRGYNTQVGYTYFDDFSTHPAACWLARPAAVGSDVRPGRGWGRAAYRRRQGPIRSPSRLSNGSRQSSALPICEKPIKLPIMHLLSGVIT